MMKDSVNVEEAAGSASNSLSPSPKVNYGLDSFGDSPHQVALKQSYLSSLQTSSPGSKVQPNMMEQYNVWLKVNNKNVVIAKHAGGKITPQRHDTLKVIQPGLGRMPVSKQDQPTVSQFSVGPPPAPDPMIQTLKSVKKDAKDDGKSKERIDTTVTQEIQDGLAVKDQTSFTSVNPRMKVERRPSIEHIFQEKEDFDEE